MSSVVGPLDAGYNDSWRWKGGGGLHRPGTETTADRSRERNSFA